MLSILVVIFVFNPLALLSLKPITTLTSALQQISSSRYAPDALLPSTSQHPPFLFLRFLPFPHAASLLPSFIEMQARGMREEGYHMCVCLSLHSGFP